MSENVVSCSGVRKVFVMGKEEVHALRGVSVDIAHGEYVSIIGPSGSGKSTLFNMIGGLDLPTEGEVQVDGVRLSELNSQQLAWFRCHKIGFIFQSFNLIPTMTALENVAIARIFAGAAPPEARQDAARMLERVGLGHRLDHLPSQVSGGQQQRIAIARALVNEPLIILADEPTGNLHSDQGREIMELFAKLNAQGTTIVQVTHSEVNAAFGKRVIQLKDGWVVDGA